MEQPNAARSTAILIFETDLGNTNDGVAEVELRKLGIVCDIIEHLNTSILKNGEVSNELSTRSRCLDKSI